MAVRNQQKERGLKKLLWIDFLSGCITGVMGIGFFRSLETFLQIPAVVILGISIVTLLYSAWALYLAQRNLPSISLTKALILANWLWVLVSVGLIYIYYSNASIPGKLFLVLQIVVVGGLAYLEGRAVSRFKK